MFDDKDLLFSFDITFEVFVAICVGLVVLYCVSALVSSKIGWHRPSVSFPSQVLWLLFNGIVAAIPVFIWVIFQLFDNRTFMEIYSRFVQYPIIAGISGIVTLIYFIVCDRLDIEVQEATRFDIHIKKSGGATYRFHIPTEFSKEFPIRAAVMFALGCVVYFIFVNLGNEDVNSFDSFLVCMFTWFISGFYSAIILSGNFDSKFPRFARFYKMINVR